MKTLKEIIDALPYKEIRGNTDLIINSVQYDSRKCTDGSLFAATIGENFDGHNFITAAINNGAVAVICEYIPETGINNGITYIVVDNSRSAMAVAAHCFYNYPARKMKVFGITGTNGKTTISFLLDSIFRNAGFRTGIIGTTGIFSGGKKMPATHTTPESVDLCGIFDRMLKDGTEFVFMEVSSHALAQHRADCIDFYAAAFTNLTHEHLDYHKTMKEYALAKNILFEMLNSQSFIAANGDDPYINTVTSGTKAELITVGRKTSNSFIISNEQQSLGYSSFCLLSNESAINNIHINLTGSYNIENAAISTVLALKAGISEEKVKSGLSTTKGAPGRMEQILLATGAIGIVDYAHTPDALQKVLTACREALNKNVDSKGKLISVFGCGGDRDKSKRPEMGYVSSKIADLSIITSDNPRTEIPGSIINDILKGIDSKSIHITVEDREEAINKAVELSQMGDIILLAGKGHEDYQIIGNKKIRFDDMEILKKHSGQL